MTNYVSVLLRSWIGWIEFWDRIAAAERVRLAAERAAQRTPPQAPALAEGDGTPAT
jgi:hypothetical protein